MTLNTKTGTVNSVDIWAGPGDQLGMANVGDKIVVRAFHPDNPDANPVELVVVSVEKHHGGRRFVRLGFFGSGGSVGA
ncbi:hypothetical protein [Candidatus Poriferisodalis sp.]|uniref:hypothetical protein n=1 Tax=Candidatus Poriferisodalis sp. TaxID=3101277 RepID=UPI003B019BE5